MKPSRIITGVAMLAMGAWALTGCLKNDIPYKKINGNFTAFAVRGELKPAAIDTVNRALTVYLADTVNPARVYVETIALTDREPQVLTTTISPEIEAGTLLDLTSPANFTIRTFQDYIWTVTAEQTIERFFRIENQIGVEQVDVTNKSILVYVPRGIALDGITVTGAQFGPSNAVVTPDPLTVTDFRGTQNFEVSYWGTTETWRVRIVQTSVTVTTGTPDAWVNVAFFKGTGQSGQDNGFKYKKSNAADWITVNPGLIESNGSTFSARITGLDASTGYVVKAYSGTNEGADVPFETQAAVPLTNGGFDDWHLSGKVYNPWLEGGTRFWDTGNRGTTTIGDSNSTPSDPAPGSSGTHSARLESRFVGFGPLGKFAAGNLFVGEYMRTEDMNGVLEFGQLYSSRPTKLKGRFNYTPGAINYASSSNPDYSAFEGKPDSCSIFIALSDANERYEIKTKPSERKMFDKNASTVIAYGEIVRGASTDGWIDFTITLDYRATNRVPKYILITTSASKYGDYFTGSTNSVLLLDDFELVFDYE